MPRFMDGGFGAACRLLIVNVRGDAVCFACKGAKIRIGLTVKRGTFLCKSADKFSMQAEGAGSFCCSSAASGLYRFLLSPRAWMRA